MEPSVLRIRDRVKDPPPGPPRSGASAQQEYEAREGELAGDRIDDVDLAGVETRRQRARRELELEDGGLAVRFVDARALDDRRLEDLDLAAVEREARADVGRVVHRRRIVDL